MAYVHPPPLHGTFDPRMSLPSRRRPSRLAGFAIVVALHAALIAAIRHVTPAPRRTVQAAPVVVRLVAAESAAVLERQSLPPPKPAPKVRPASVQMQTPVPPRSEAPAAPAVAAVPTSIAVESARAAVSEPPAAVASAPIIARDAAPLSITPPRFDAEYLRNPSPAYPPIARRNGEQGRVLLHVLVAANGTAQVVALKASSGHERLDHAALETVRLWHFVPARQGDEAVAAWVVVPIAFALARG